MGKQNFDETGRLSNETDHQHEVQPELDHVDIFTNEDVPKSELPFFQDEQLIDQGQIVPHVGRLIQKNFRERQKQKKLAAKILKFDSDSDNDGFDKFPALKEKCSAPVPEKTS